MKCRDKYKKLKNLKMIKNYHNSFCRGFLINALHNICVVFSLYCIFVNSADFRSWHLFNIDEHSYRALTTSNVCCVSEETTDWLATCGVTFIFRTSTLSFFSLVLILQKKILMVFSFLLIKNANFLLPFSTR